MPAGVFGGSEVVKEMKVQWRGVTGGQFPEALFHLETPGSRRYFQRKAKSEG